ncbi:MAG: winged helix-turn-helix domain-containing protein [Candidatus Methanomethylicaceae archaeon]|jgi:DNA-binding transcriptional ArsR family regulator
MSSGENKEGFNKARAELFDALGHPTRIKILQALEESPLSFTELRKKANIDSNGLLSFHLGKLGDLIKTVDGGNYALTADGKEALRIVSLIAVREGRKSRFDYPNVVIVIWTVAMFISFGLLSNLFDQEGVLYHLGQGAFIALFMGAIMWIVRWFALRRAKTSDTMRLTKLMLTCAFIFLFSLSLLLLRLSNVLGSEADILIQWLSVISLILLGVFVGTLISQKQIRVRTMLVPTVLFVLGFIAAPFVGIGVLMLFEHFGFDMPAIFGVSIAVYLLLYMGLWFWLRKKGILKRLNP